MEQITERKTLQLKAASTRPILKLMPKTEFVPEKKEEPVKRKPKGLRKEQYQEILKVLSEKYPQVFGSEVKILSIGIHQAIAQDLGIPTMIARSFLRRYCLNKRYLEARIVGTNRYDLEGNVTGQVTEDGN